MNNKRLLPGPPSKFTEDLGATICARIALGESANGVSKSMGISKSTVSYWARQHKEFADRYRAAQCEKLQSLAELRELHKKSREDYMLQKLVAIGESRRRIGEDHPHAKLTNREVDQLLQMHEEGWGYKKLAAAFELSRSHVRNICKGKKRCQTPAGYKTVMVAA